MDIQNYYANISLNLNVMIVQLFTPVFCLLNKQKVAENWKNKKHDICVMNLDRSEISKIF